MTGRGPPIIMESEEENSKKEKLSPQEELMAKYAVKNPDNRATRMAKEAGITSLDNVTYKQIFRVYTEVLINMLDHNNMDFWPYGMSGSPAPPAQQHKTIFDLYCASCAYFAK